MSTPSRLYPRRSRPDGGTLDTRPRWLSLIEEHVATFDSALWMVPAQARATLTADLRAHLMAAADHGGRAPHDSVTTAILQLGSIPTMVRGARWLHGLRWELRVVRALVLLIAVLGTTPLVGSAVLLTTPVVILAIALAGMEMDMRESVIIGTLAVLTRCALLALATLQTVPLGSSWAITLYGVATALLLLPAPLAAHLRMLQVQRNVSTLRPVGPHPPPPSREPRLEPDVTRMLAAIDE